MSRFSITLGEYEKSMLDEYVELRNGIKENTAVNDLIKRGLNKSTGGTEDDMIRLAVREQIKFSVKPFTESLSSKAAKSAHMSGRTVYLFLEMLISGMGYTKEIQDIIMSIKTLSNFSNMNLSDTFDLASPLLGEFHHTSLA